MALTVFDHVRGVAILAVGFAMLVLGTPGLDLLAADRWLAGTPQRERMLTQPFGRLVVAAADVNRVVRDPLVDVLTPLQRPLRLAQSWGLYGSGPRDVRRFEIRVDGRLVYRSSDSELTWLRAELRYRKLRPIADAHCVGESKNSDGLATWIATRARQDFPGVQEVTISCAATPWPGDGEEKQVHRRRLVAPDWWVGN